ncbi:MAG: acyloxyacyl hydrolase [Planctomycetota bacterium]
MLQRALQLICALSVVAACGAGARADGPPRPTGLLVESAALRDLFTPMPAWSAQDQDNGSLTGEADPTFEPVPVTLDFGQKGSQRFQYFFGGGIRGSDASEWFVQGSVAWSWFIADDLSIDIELGASYWDGETDEAVGGSATLLFRWHFYTEPNWSIYFDGGAGLMGTSEPIPNDGTQYNFTPQAGMGVSFDISANTRMLAGFRWHHVSNASLSADNPGMDNAYFYLGFSQPF